MKLYIHLTEQERTVLLSENSLEGAFIFLKKNIQKELDGIDLDDTDEVWELELIKKSKPIAELKIKLLPL